MREIMIYNEVKECTEEEFDTISKFFTITEKDALVKSNSLDIDGEVYVLHIEHIFKDETQFEEFKKAINEINGFYRTDEKLYRQIKQSIPDNTLWSDEHSEHNRLKQYGRDDIKLSLYDKYDDEYIYLLKTATKNNTKNMKCFNRKLAKIIKDLNICYYSEVKRVVPTVIVKTNKEK